MGVRDTDNELVNNWILSFQISEKNKYEWREIYWGSITGEVTFEQRTDG